MKIPDTLKDLQVDIDSLQPYDGNPRRGDVEMIMASLVANGQYRPITVNKRDMSILTGNHTWRAARELGWKKIAATFVDVDEAAARAIVLVDNRTNDLAGYDESQLLELLQEVAPGELEGTGFTEEDLADLLAHLQPPSLDELAAEYGTAEGEEGWPVIRVAVPPETFVMWNDVMTMAPGESEAEKVEHICTLLLA